MKNLLFIASILIGISGYSQDIHFSQIYNTPLLLNPGLTGSFEGNIRVIGNWKDQWQGVKTSLPGLQQTKGAYRTFGISFDQRFDFDKRGGKGAYFAYGLNAYSDMAGDVSLGTINVLASVAGGIKFKRYHDFGLGIQGGWGYTTIDQNALRFPSAYENPGYTPVNMSFTPTSWGDVSAGLAYKFNNQDKHKVKIMRAGIAAYHLNTPNYSFSETGELSMRFVAHWAGYFGFKENKMGLWPSVSYQYQSPHSETMIGMLYRIVLNDSKNKFALGFGVHSRISLNSIGTQSEGNIISDAIIPEMQVEYAGFVLGLNYDINISTLSQASRYRGGMEMSLRYIWNKDEGTVQVQI